MRLQRARSLHAVTLVTLTSALPACSRDLNDRPALGSGSPVVRADSTPGTVPLRTLDRADWPAIRVDSPIDGVVHGPVRRALPTRLEGTPRQLGLWPTAESAVALQPPAGVPGLDLVSSLAGGLGELAWMPVDTVLSPPGSARQQIGLWKRSPRAEGTLGWRLADAPAEDPTTASPAEAGRTTEEPRR